MTTDAQIEAARVAWFKAGGLFAEDCATAFRAALEAAERAGWRPIAEAPKGNCVSLGPPLLVKDGYGIRIARWDPDLMAGRPRPHWWTAGMSTTDCRRNPPTHFRLIPAPPVSE